MSKLTSMKDIEKIVTFHLILIEENYKILYINNFY